MQYTRSFASAFLFQLLLSFLGVQWNPLILPPVHSFFPKRWNIYLFNWFSLLWPVLKKAGWCRITCLFFFFFSSCLSPLLQVFGLLLHLFSICKFWRSSSAFLYSVSDDVLWMWTLAKKSKTGKSLICSPSLWLQVLSVQAGVLREQCCQLSHHDTPQSTWAFKMSKQKLPSKWSLLCSARYSAQYQMNFPHYL